MCKFLVWSSVTSFCTSIARFVMFSSQQGAFLFLSVICFVNLEQADARCADPAVCVQWYNDIYYQSKRSCFPQDDGLTPVCSRIWQLPFED